MELHLKADGMGEAFLLWKALEASARALGREYDQAFNAGLAGLPEGDQAMSLAEDQEILSRMASELRKELFGKNIFQFFPYYNGSGSERLLIGINGSGEHFRIRSGKRVFVLQDSGRWSESSTEYLKERMVFSFEKPW